MKTLIRALLLSCALSAPVLAFAQTANAPVTRAEVRADLIQVEKAGYRPGNNDVHYPSDIQAAEAKVAAQDDSTLAMQSMGGMAAGSAQSGVAAASSTTTSTPSLFLHH
ncbi:DUF4148 domain-containing protein [Paraburkholderia sp. A1RI_3L]|uniref:DUF4148 domain-containing protein n=1 Tax=Paraburkholderia TaxID=1822464 RepID=UPI00034D1A6D|nr:MULTISPECIES: DUF4148 domain-containing protein [Paraburkholderia]WEY41184.1 DUF4148 domain-containing protein [Paraburkholderia sp. SUR17]